MRLRTSSRALRAASRASAKRRRQLLVDDLGDDPLDVAVAQLGLGLAFELGVGDADADDRRQTLLEVLAGDLEVFVLGRARLLSVAVQRASQGAPEPRQVRPPVDRVEVVAVRDDGLADRLVVLQGHLDLDRSLIIAATKEGRRVDRLLRPVEVSDELGKTPRREELGVLRFVAALIG